jgi:hypothetical protein
MTKAIQFGNWSFEFVWDLVLAIYPMPYATSSLRPSQKLLGPSQYPHWRHPGG